jgi:tRNA (cmo5U34)-methyltransferase
VNKQELEELFGRQAATYDQQWVKLQPLRDTSHLLLGAVLGDLPTNARVLCVGAGTGAELLYLAGRFPEWHFTAVEPAGPMLDVCRRRAEADGVASRCVFHQGYVETLPAESRFDAATAFLVSQFILDRDARTGFFRAIAERLRPGGYLVSSDLTADLSTTEGQELMEIWFRLMTGTVHLPAESINAMRNAYAKDVAVRPREEVASVIAAGGFERPTALFQNGLILGWYARRGP